MGNQLRSERWRARNRHRTIAGYLITRGPSLIGPRGATDDISRAPSNQSPSLLASVLQAASHGFPRALRGALEARFSGERVNA